jgi:pilus assembly protein CpaE
VVNRYGASDDLDLTDVERTLGATNLRTVPNSYAAVAMSVNRGIPIAQLARGNPVSRAIDELAQAQQPHAVPATSWFGRLLKRA